MGEASAEGRRIFTIGHSNQSLESFVDLLRRHEIAAVVDARSYPRSAYASQFDRQHLKQALRAQTIRYAFLGQELGGRPRDEAFYDQEGHALYSRIAESPAFNLGIRQLEKAIERYRVAIMCSEEDPAGCHRHLLIARVLAKRGICVFHIRGDGRIQTEQELRQAQRDARPRSDQLALFDEPIEEPEEAAWRSIRSVLPKRARPSSSDQ